MSVNSMATYYGGTNWTRNVDYFLAENNYDTTATSVATSAAAGYIGVGGQGVTLISNRHVLMANHVSSAWGQSFPNAAQFPITVYFVNNSNTVFTYTIDSIANVSTIGPSSGPGYTDISIGYLNTTVDPSLSFYKVAPISLFKYIQYGALKVVYPITEQLYSPYFPVFWMDGGDTPIPPLPNPYIKRTWCGTLEYTVVSNAGSGVVNTFSVKWPATVPRSNNCQQVKGGDSGNIIFTTLNNQIVIIGTWYTDGSGIGPGSTVGTCSNIYPYIFDFNVSGYPDIFPGINTVMNTLAGTSPDTYSVTQADLSSFYVYN